MIARTHARRHKRTPRAAEPGRPTQRESGAARELFGKAPPNRPLCARVGNETPLCRRVASDRGFGPRLFGSYAPVCTLLARKRKGGVVGRVGIRGAMLRGAEKRSGEREGARARWPTTTVVAAGFLDPVCRRSAGDSDERVSPRFALSVWLSRPHRSAVDRPPAFPRGCGGAGVGIEAGAQAGERSRGIWGAVEAETSPGDGTLIVVVRAAR